MCNNSLTAETQPKGSYRSQYEVGLTLINTYRIYMMWGDRELFNSLLPRPTGQGFCAQRTEKILWRFRLAPNLAPNPLLLPPWEK